MALAVALVAAGGSAARAITPESPEVRRAVDKACEFLRQESDVRLGGNVLAARAMFYAGTPDDAVVQQALESIDLAARVGFRSHDLYSVSLAVLLLVELDAETHHPRLRKLVDHLVEVQKPHGGWGYPDRPTGDTSMTQYTILALWVAEQAGISAPRETWVKAVNWLLRTQDPQGGWGYQGADPGNFTRVMQPELSRSMSLAGLNCLYLAGHTLGAIRWSSGRRPLPGALKPVEDLVSSTVAIEGVDVARFREAIELGQRFFAATDLPVHPDYPFYYLYSFERFQSAREAMTGRPFGSSAWYDQIASDLLAKQAADGSWTAGEGKVPATGFAVLVLLRSTRKIIAVESLGAGVLVGGRGLPAGQGAIELRGGQAAAPRLTGPAGDVLAALEDPRNPHYLGALAALETLPVEPGQPLEPTLRDRLTTLADSGDPKAQAAALATLARTRQLDYVPLLIEALSSADPDVAVAALEGLRFVARRLGPRQLPGFASEADRQREIFFWRNWYSTVRPAEGPP